MRLNTWSKALLPLVVVGVVLQGTDSVVMASGIAGLKFGDAAAHARYRFETATADFHVCARCGAVPLVISEIDGGVYAVVNVNTFENVEPSRLRHAEVRFDGEETDARLARRRRGWIGRVRFVDGNGERREPDR